MARPTTAPRLLVHLMWAHPPTVLPIPGTGAIEIPSLRKVAVQLGTVTKRINQWLLTLEDQGRIEGLVWSPNRRSVQLRIVRPPNIGK